MGSLRKYKTLRDLSFASRGVQYTLTTSTFENKEFSKAVSDGIVSVLDNFIKNEIMSTYVVIRSVNDSIKIVKWLLKIGLSGY